MTRKAQTTTMDKVRDAVLGTEGSGSLYRWLRQHHDEFADLLVQVPRPNWRKIRDALSEEKLLDSEGKPPTPERVRQTWVKVRKDVAEARGKSGGKAAAPKPQPASVSPVVRVLEKPAEPAPKPAQQNQLDDLAASMDAGRSWIPKPPRRRS